jgi:tRNA pseudouridine65 synthase
MAPQIISAVATSRRTRMSRPAVALRVMVLLLLLSLLHHTDALANNKAPGTQYRGTRIAVIRYEDDWVCVNKPAGISVHRSANTRRNEVTLRSLLKKQLARKVFPVHRLDHRTSGVILFAFDSATCGKIHDQLKRGDKDYIALMRGEWRYDTDRVVIDEPLKVDGVLKEATTEFQLIANGSNDNNPDMPCCLVKCMPRTGRTHQIRRHAYHLGHPILGDSQHGDSRVNRMWRTKRGLNRLALHCLSIQLGVRATDSLANDDDEIDDTTTLPPPCLIAPLSPELRTVLEEDAGMWQTIIDYDPRFVLDPVDERGGTFGRHYKNRSSKDENELVVDASTSSNTVEDS